MDDDFLNTAADDFEVLKVGGDGRLVGEERGVVPSGRGGIIFVCQANITTTCTDALF